MSPFRRARSRLLPCALAALLAAAGCGEPDDEPAPRHDGSEHPNEPGDPNEPEEPEEPEQPAAIVDLVVDANRNGRLDPGLAAEDEGEDAFTATAGAVFLANLDDDDADGRKDHENETVDGAADLLDLAPVLVAPWPDAPDGATGLLTVEHAAQIRLFRLGGDEADPAAWIHVADPARIELSAADLRAGVRFGVEGRTLATSIAEGAWDGTVRFVLAVSDEAGVKLGEDVALLRVAPLLLQFNTAPTEEVYYTGGESWNRGFALGVEAATDHVGVELIGLELPGSRFDWDQWTQDFFDVGFTSRPGPDGTPVGMKVAIRSAQPDRRAGGVVETHFAGPDWGTVFIHATRWDPETHGYSMNSFGNWEVVPPYQGYPLGRNVWGSGTRADEMPDATFVDFVRAQRVQPEIVVDTSWLVVGHTDEVFSWVRADTPRGWRMLVGDPARARDMLLELQQNGHGDAVLFRGKKWVDFFTGNEIAADVTVDEILADDDLMAASQLARVRTGEMFDVLQAELALEEDEVVPMPFLYEEWFGDLVAHQPGTVNLLHVDGAVAIPDPFGPVIDGVDVFEADLEQRLGALGLEVFFVDNWDIYHRNLGEVHCGTNVSRRMDDLRWWESGR